MTRHQKIISIGYILCLLGLFFCLTPFKQSWYPDDHYYYGNYFKMNQAGKVLYSRLFMEIGVLTFIYLVAVRMFREAKYIAVANKGINQE